MGKVRADNLVAELNKILESYGDSVMENMRDAVKAAAQKGAQALNSEASTKFGTVKAQDKKYAGSWKAKTESKGYYSTAVIYSDKPGLPHLLEYGHALKGGGRSGFVPGREHIKPVEDKLVEEFEQAICKGAEQ
jgi:hypothetical protein